MRQSSSPRSHDTLFPSCALGSYCAPPCLLCTALASLDACSHSVFVSTASLAPLLLALSDLRANLDGVTNTVNGAASDRIHQLSVETDQRIKQLNDTIKNGGDRIDLFGA